MNKTSMTDILMFTELWVNIATVGNEMQLSVYFQSVMWSIIDTGLSLCTVLVNVKICLITVLP